MAGVVLPARPYGKTLFRLSPPVVTENLHGGGVQLNRPVARIRLRSLHEGALCSATDGPSDVENAGAEVDVVPAEEWDFPRRIPVKAINHHMADQLSSDVVARNR